MRDLLRKTLTLSITWLRMRSPEASDLPIDIPDPWGAEAWAFRREEGFGQGLWDVSSISTAPGGRAL